MQPRASPFVFYAQNPHSGWHISVNKNWNYRSQKKARFVHLGTFLAPGIICFRFLTGLVFAPVLVGVGTCLLILRSEWCLQHVVSCAKVWDLLQKNSVCLDFEDHFSIIGQQYNKNVWCFCIFRPYIVACHYEGIYYPWQSLSSLRLVHYIVLLPFNIGFASLVLDRL